MTRIDNHEERIANHEGRIANHEERIARLGEIYKQLIDMELQSDKSMDRYDTIEKLKKALVHRDGRIAGLLASINQIADQLGMTCGRDVKTVVEEASKAIDLTNNIRKELIDKENQIVYLLSSIEQIASALGMTWDAQDDVDDVVLRVKELTGYADRWRQIDNVFKRLAI